MNTAISNIFVLFIGLILITLSFGVNGQSRSLTDRMPSNRWSLEAKYGGGFPLSKWEDESNETSYRIISENSFSLGVRYMLTHTLGIRVNYHYHDFDKTGKESRLQSQTIGAELVYSFSDFSREGRISNPRKINFLAHAGTGLTYAKNPGDDGIILSEIGATLQWRPISPYFAFTFDLTASINSLQAKGFNGKSNESSDYVWGKFKHAFTQPEFFMYPSIGIQYYFGNWGKHVDWR